MSQFASGGSAAALFGVAAGIVYATTAALLKTLTGIAGAGVAAVAGSCTSLSSSAGRGWC